MTRDDSVTPTPGHRPPVTPLTSDQRRDLPANAPATPSVLAPKLVTSPPQPLVAVTPPTAAPASKPPFVSHESLPGRTLRDEITRRTQKDQRFSVEEVRRIAVQLCQALRAMPTQDIPRAVSPETVIWSETGAIELREGKVPAESGVLDADGSAGALPSRSTHHRDDQRDVAAILFELLTGLVPREPLVAPHELRKNVPRPLSQAVRRALSSEPSQRFSSIAEFHKHLSGPTGARQQRLELVATAVAVLLAIVGLVSWTMTRPPPPNPEDKIQFAQQIVLTEEARKRAEQVDAEIFADAKRMADDVDKWQRELISAQEGKKPLQEEYAQQRLAQAQPAHEIASQVAELWKKHVRRTTWSSEAGGKLARAKALAESGSFAEALTALQEGDASVQFPLQWRENAHEAIALAKTARSELQDRLEKAEGQPGTPYAWPQRLLDAIPAKLTQDDGKSSVADVRTAQESLPKIEQFLTLRQKVTQAAKQSDEVSEIQEARTEVARVEQIVHEGDDALAAGQFAKAQERFDTAIENYRTLPLTAIRALITLAEAKAAADNATTRLKLIDAVFRIAVDSADVKPLHAKAYRLRAEGYLAQGNHAAALNACEASIQLDQLQPATFLIRASVHLQQRQFPLAINDCNAALQLNATLPEALHRRGLAKFQLKQWDAALADLTQALQQNPKLTDALTTRGMIYLVQGQHDQALADFNASLKRDATQHVTLTERAKLWRVKRDWEHALQDCGEALRLQPSFAEAYLVRSSVWVSQRELDKALADLDQAKRLQPQNALIELSRGEVWLLKPNHQKAVTAFTEALRLDPQLVEAYQQRGLAWQRLEQWDKALADYNETLLHNPRALEAYLRRASVWVSKGDVDKALADYTLALQLDGRNVVALLGRATARLAKGDYDRAIQDATAALKLDPGSLSLLRVRAVASIKTKAYDQAIADLNVVLGAEAKSVDDLLHRASAWLEKGEADKSLEDCQTAIRLDANNARAFEARSKAWFKKGDVEKANADYNTSLRLGQKPAKPK